MPPVPPKGFWAAMASGRSRVAGPVPYRRQAEGRRRHRLNFYLLPALFYLRKGGRAPQAPNRLATSR